MWVPSEWAAHRGCFDTEMKLASCAINGDCKYTADAVVFSC